MEPTELRKFREILSTAYKNLDEPDFTFVKKVFNARPYDPLIKRLRDYAAVEELCEAEDDVCFSFLLKGQASLWKLDLSVVGPFGIFARMKARTEPGDFLHYGKEDVVGFERRILDILQSAGIKLMTVDELSIDMPMTLFNTDRAKVKLYQALFSDREPLPWEA
jgi:hypothetical protein